MPDHDHCPTTKVTWLHIGIHKALPNNRVHSHTKKAREIHKNCDHKAWEPHNWYRKQPPWKDFLKSGTSHLKTQRCFSNSQGLHSLQIFSCLWQEIWTHRSTVIFPCAQISYMRVSWNNRREFFISVFLRPTISWNCIGRNFLGSTRWFFNHSFCLCGFQRGQVTQG